jgi:hypothetical protein
MAANELKRNGKLLFRVEEERGLVQKIRAIFKLT